MTKILNTEMSLCMNIICLQQYNLNLFHINAIALAWCDI